MADDRPKPQYGELAPEGWVWQPPAPPQGSDVPVPVVTQPQGSRPTADARSTADAQRQRAAHTPAPLDGPSRPLDTGSQKPVSVGDVSATALLLFLGVLFSASWIPILFDFNSVILQAAAVQGYSSLVPSSATNAVGAAVGTTTIVVQLLSVIISVRRISRRKLAFPVPLIAGALTFALWVGAITFAFLSDPSFITQISTP